MARSINTQHQEARGLFWKWARCRFYWLLSLSPPASCGLPELFFFQAREKQPTVWITFDPQQLHSSDFPNHEIVLLKFSNKTVVVWFQVNFGKAKGFLFSHVVLNYCAKSKVKSQIIPPTHPQDLGLLKSGNHSNFHPRDNFLHVSVKVEAMVWGDLEWEPLNRVDVRMSISLPALVRGAYIRILAKIKCSVACRENTSATIFSFSFQKQAAENISSSSI